MVAFDEQTLPGCRKSTKVLSSDVYKYKVTPHTSEPWKHVHRIDGFQQIEGKLQLCKEKSTGDEEKLKDLYVQKHCEEMNKSPHIFLAKGITAYVSLRLRVQN